MQVSTTTSLREHKRIATRQAIEEAAVEIAFEQGYEAATAEAIAARAGVSLRTFFNYFPSKDIAIIGSDMTVIDERHAHALLEECEPHLLKGIARVVEASSAEVDPNSELMQRRCFLAHQNLPLLQRHLMAIDEFEAALTRIVADHLRDKPSRRRLTGKVTIEEEARLIVTMVGSAMRCSVFMWVKNDLDVSLRPQVLENILALMAEIHRED